MKKRILTWLLAISMLGSLLTVPAGAAAVTKFSDVSDSYTATAVESLRLMGVLDGYGDGTFRPDTVLNRAQFCKMAVYAMDGSGELGRYSTVTIFPDVKPSHWASAYINMASKKGIISGFADGKFKPSPDRDRRTGCDDPHAGPGLQRRGHGRRVAPELHGGGPDQRPFEIHRYHLRLRGPDPRAGGQAVPEPL